MVYIMQAITLKKYPAQLSLTTWMSFVGGVQSAVFTEFTQHKPSAWRIGFDIDFWAILYGGGCLWSDHINPTMVYRTEFNVESNLKITSLLAAPILMLSRVTGMEEFLATGRIPTLLNCRFGRIDEEMVNVL